MKTMKKVLSVLLLVCMLSSMCAVSAYADEPAADVTTPTLSFADGDTALSEITLDLNESKSNSTYDMKGKIRRTSPSSWSGDEPTWGWVVGDTNIISFASDVITALSVGNTTLTATNTYGNDGPSVSAALTVHVINSTPDKIEISGTCDLAHDATSTTLEATLKSVDGKTITATDWTWSVPEGSGVTVTPDSENTNKCTVTRTGDNSASAVSATVTVSTGGKTQTTTVTFTKKPVTINEVKVAWNDSTKQYEATPTFSDSGSHSVTWSWGTKASNVSVTGNGNTCTISNNTYEEITNISLTATATAIDGTDISPTVPGSVTIASLPGKDKSMTIDISSSTLYAGRSYTLSAMDGSTPVTGVAFTVDTSETSCSTGSATISGGNTIQFGLNARRIKVTATASGYAPAEKYFDVTPNVKLSAGKSTLYAGKSDSTTLSATYIDNGNDIPNDVASWSIKSQTADASISGNTLTAGSKTGTVECMLSAYGIELGTVTVTIAEYSAIDFTLNVTGNSTASTTVDTIYAKKGVITLTAANAIDTSKGKAAVSGTFKFSFASNTDTPVGGIGLTDHGNGVATVSGNYNGTYIIRADFYPTGATTPTATKYHTIYVNYTPTFVGGNYAVWDGVNGLDFLVDDSIYNYNGQIWVDGHLLSDANYLCRSSSDGRIWVTLKPEFISWLRQYYNGNGTHTIAVGINNRNAATGYFKTWGTASSFNGVKTGDEANLGLWITLLTLSAAGTAAAVVLYKRKKSNG